MIRRPHSSFASPSEVPISELNTTPLIDVMLVLLIMFIITIPIAKHKVPVDLPTGTPPQSEKPVIHSLELDAVGQISLDGAPITQAELPERLARIEAERMSDLLLRADGEAPYERFDQVLAIVKRSGITRLGMVDNHKFVAALN